MLSVLNKYSFILKKIPIYYQCHNVFKKSVKPIVGTYKKVYVYNTNWNIVNNEIPFNIIAEAFRSLGIPHNYWPLKWMCCN